jgi:hypothetical protein
MIAQGFRQTWSGSISVKNNLTPHRDFIPAKDAIAGPRNSSAAAEDQQKTLSATAISSKGVESMKLIPWEDIWTSLSVARIRGNGEMIDVFYDTLFKEAVFDDDGAWSLNKKRF